MLVLIDYGIGNLRSVQKALEAIGTDAVRTGNPDDVRAADKLILPGVGAFGACAEALRRHDLEQPILDAVDGGTPLLGVCVGMQLLFQTSEEKGEHRGLGLLPGRIVRFSNELAGEDGRRLKVPHVGWNRIVPTGHSALTAGLVDGAYVYFVHSYFARPAHASDVLATTPYGVDFPSVVGRNRVFGVQFHPEKSQTAGLQILRNFVERID